MKINININTNTGPFKPGDVITGGKGRYYLVIHRPHGYSGGEAADQPWTMINLQDNRICWDHIGNHDAYTLVQATLEVSP